MRETPLTNCEKEFIKTAISKKLRIDGRQAYDYRHMKISFGLERGCCQLQLGDTRVMAQVSCQIVEPKPVRPADGSLYINVELSPMACPSFEAGRLSDFGVEINRLLERCLKESRCVDTESLCIIAGEKVWEIRVDVHVLNHDGNLVDACSIAAIAALSHFRRPDVTVSGDEITIHPASERDPVPLSVHHMPICVSFAFFEKGKFLLVGSTSTDIEEKVMDGQMVIGMNKHRQICTLQITGQMLLLKEQVLRCSNIAVVKVAEITELIHKALDNDRLERTKGGKFGFAESVSLGQVTTNHVAVKPIDISSVEGQMASAVLHGSDDNEINSDLDTSEVEEEEQVVIMDKGFGAIGTGGTSTWNIDDEMTELHEEQKSQSKLSGPKLQQHVSAAGAVEDLSEEEITETLEQQSLFSTNKNSEDILPVHSTANSGQKRPKKRKS